MRAGDWMQTATGRKFWPIDPRPEDVDIADIAHALSLMCRFGGHCTRFYSVAEHSLYVSAVASPDSLWGLLHDASEAYISDIVRPAKRFIAGYREIEERILAAVRVRFGLSPVCPESVRRADMAVLAAESVQVMGSPPEPWDLPESPADIVVRFLSPADAEREFLEVFSALTGRWT
jgi:uncharacterized protein